MPANPPADAQSISASTSRSTDEAEQPFLTFKGGDDRERRYSFAPDVAQAAVGRQPPADLVLDWDPQVSRLHARFERSGDEWELVDDGLSRNGTFVNQERLEGRRRLQDGDALRFGSTAVTFHSPARVQPRPVQTAPAPSGGVGDAPDGGGPTDPPAVALSSTQRRVLAALCRPYKERGGFASPASDQQIADELIMSIGEVRTHLKVLYAKLAIDAQARGESRVRLVEKAFATGLISEREL